MGYRFDWAWSGLGLVFMGLGWAELRILEPIPNTVIKRFSGLVVAITCSQMEQFMGRYGKLVTK